MEKMMPDKWSSLEEMLEWAESGSFLFEGEYGDKWSKEDTIACIKQMIEYENSQGIQDSE